MSIATQMDPRRLSIGDTPIHPVDTTVDDSNPLDRDWMKVAFMVSDIDLADPTDIANRYWSSASARFTDTRLGCNIGINPRPQWTRYSDIRVKGRLSDRETVSLSNVSGNYGMGRAYAEGIDEPSQRIYMRFGVPAFNGLATFLTRAFNREQTILARTGRAPSAWYKLFKVVGTALTTVAFPALAVTVGVGKAMYWLMGRPTSKFFNLKPTMYLYWSTVNLLVNNHAVNYGIFKKIGSNEEGEQRLSRPYKLDEDQMREIQALMPDVFSPSGYFDIYFLANKAQRIANQLFMKDYEALDKATSTTFTGYLKREYSGKGRHSTYISKGDGSPTMEAMLNRMVMMGDYFGSDVKEDDGKVEKDPRVVADPEESHAPREDSRIQAMLKYADAEFKDGSAFAIFRVDHSGSVSESFSNSVAESDLAQKLNGISSDFREARFTLADGNLFGGVFDSIKSGIENVAMGLLDGVSLGFAGLIPGLGGSGYIDIPKHWQSSAASLPRASYKIRLFSPYNNPISRMINIWIPFYMLLAAATPRSTGKSSYTSPYYCQLFDRGRLQSKLAMVESLSITRGTSNLQFDVTGQALAIDISLNVVDLSTIMHMPVASGLMGEADITLDEDNITMDYMSVLAGMDIYSQIYPFTKAQLKLTKKLLTLKQMATSPAYHVAMFKNSLEDGFLSSVTFGATNALVGAVEGASRGSASLSGTLGET